MTADQITIAITVYNRRRYLPQAITSALDQTVPVRVTVVEDCGPDAGLEAFVKEQFGSRVDYIRNPRRRGLFGNWNACIEYCKTPWLSICHDDDYLRPGFVAAMIELNAQARDCGLYFGRTAIVDEAGELIPQYADPAARHLSPLMGPMTERWRPVRLQDVLFVTPFPFPGQLIRIDAARALGGFRESSVYTGDWEMWAKLIAFYGSAQTCEEVACNRTHFGEGRGTGGVVQGGKMFTATYVERKRILALARQKGLMVAFDRRDDQAKCPMSILFLLRFGSGLSPRLLRYNIGLMLLSKAPNWKYAVFQMLTRIFGRSFVLPLSRLWNLRASPDSKRW